MTKLAQMYKTKLSYYYDLYKKLEHIDAPISRWQRNYERFFEVYKSILNVSYKDSSLIKLIEKYEKLNNKFLAKVSVKEDSAENVI